MGYAPGPGGALFPPPATRLPRIDPFTKKGPSARDPYGFESHKFIQQSFETDFRIIAFPDLSVGKPCTSPRKLPEPRADFSLGKVFWRVGITLASETRQGVATPRHLDSACCAATSPRRGWRPLKRRALGTMTYQVFPAQEVVSRLDVMRVKDLEEICTALNMRKSGKKSELVGRLKTMCASSVLVHAAGGKAAVERVINSAYYRFTEEKGHAYVHRPSPGAKRKLSESAYGDASGWNKPQAGVPVNTPASVDHGVWARALAADPFWAAADEPKLASTPGVVMAPTRLRVSPGTRNHLMLHRPFQITDAQARLLRSDRNKYELQIACVLMDDPVPARLHWPFLANLRVNGRPLPVMYRQSTSPMGKAGRDPPVAVPPGVLLDGKQHADDSGAGRSPIFRVGARSEASDAGRSESGGAGAAELPDSEHTWSASSAAEGGRRARRLGRRPHCPR